MKELNIYKELVGSENTKDVFEYLMKSLRYTIANWSYYVDWNKVKEKALKYKTELNILNTLIGSTNINQDFLNLCIKYPEIKKVLPSLIAIRQDKLNKLRVFDIELSEEFLARETFAGNNSEKLLSFFEESGLKSLFEDRTIKNLVDYTLGVEVGMDTNARKNRTGTAMESLVEEIIKEHCLNNDYEYGIQMTPAKIQEKWNISVPSDKSERRFDFVINAKGKLFMFEVNFYSGGGSKLKATAGEYMGLDKILSESGFTFIWITDGAGWNTDHLHLEEAFNKNDYIFNLNMLKLGILKELI